MKPRVVFKVRFDAVLAPVRGQIPLCVGSWSPRLQVLWFTRYRDILMIQRDRIPYWQREPLLLDTYWVNSLGHKGTCCSVCVINPAKCPDATPSQVEEDGGCCHKDQSPVEVDADLYAGV